LIDHSLLSPRFGELLPDYTRERVGSAADDEAYRAHGIRVAARLTKRRPNSDRVHRDSKRRRQLRSSHR
jgi:hypothetical protein